MNMKNMSGGLQQMMRQANQLQMKLGKLREELGEREYDATTGGDAVSVRVSGKNQLLSVKISDELMKSGDVDMLQDLILTATNEALKKAKDTGDAEIQKLTGGMSLPGMF